MRIYIGGNVGAAFDDNTDLREYPTGAFLTDPNAAQYTSIFTNTLSSRSGFTGGFTAGYNWQSGMTVFGLEGDIDSLNRRSSANVPFTYVAPLAGFGFNALTYKESWLGTFRGRLGFTPMAPWLFYVTGGLAIGNPSSSVTSVSTPGFNWAGSTSASTRAGYTAGAGVEWAIAPNWSVKAEYLYVDLGSRTYSVAAAATNPNLAYTLSATERDRYSIARIGVDYHFGGPTGGRY